MSLRTRVPGESVPRGAETADAEGCFVIHVEPRPSDGVMWNSFLEITAAGFAPSQLDRVYLPPPSYDVGPIVLHRPVELRGRVTSTGGRPVVGAAVHAALGRVQAPYGDHARRAPIAITGADGAYVCRALPPGRVTLGASAEGFADRISDVHELAQGVNHVDFVLEPEHLVLLRVSGVDGQALADAAAEPLGDMWGPGPWAEQHRHRAFWRGTEPADAAGCITLHGLDDTFTGHVRVSARDRRPALVLTAHDDVRVALEPVRWIDVAAASTDGGAPPQIHGLVIRDITRRPSWCGNCDDNRLAKLWRDSPAVERLAPDRWRVAWNSSSCYVDGGPPGAVTIFSSTAGSASVELPKVFPPGTTQACTVLFDVPACLAGMARTAEGGPVSLRLGVQLSGYRSDWLAVLSDASGRFEFDRIAAGPHWLYSLDDRWEVEDGDKRVELTPGETRSGLIVTVRPRSDGRTGRVRGRLLIDGGVPAEPLLLALDEVPNQHLPDAYPRALVWTDREGNFQISSFWPRTYHILAKHRPPAPGGGWRDFAAEFPAHGSGWKWVVDIPESGVTEGVVIDLPSESRWDSVAPPEPDDER